MQIKIQTIQYCKLSRKGAQPKSPFQRLEEPRQGLGRVEDGLLLELSISAVDGTAGHSSAVHSHCHALVGPSTTIDGSDLVHARLVGALAYFMVDVED
ncbi:hypothetical protein ACLOJK_035203 [Asimina triloba]